jgi:hypothetical protein
MERAANTLTEGFHAPSVPRRRPARLSHRSTAAGTDSPARRAFCRVQPAPHFLKLTFSAPDARLVPVRPEEGLA